MEKLQLANPGSLNNASTMTNKVEQLTLDLMIKTNGLNDTIKMYVSVLFKCQEQILVSHTCGKGDFNDTYDALVSIESQTKTTIAYLKSMKRISKFAEMKLPELNERINSLKESIENKNDFIGYNMIDLLSIFYDELEATRNEIFDRENENRNNQSIINREYIAFIDANEIEPTQYNETFIDLDEYLEEKGIDTNESDFVSSELDDLMLNLNFTLGLINFKIDVCYQIDCYDYYYGVKESQIKEHPYKPKMIDLNLRITRNFIALVKDELDIELNESEMMYFITKHYK